MGFLNRYREIPHRDEQLDHIVEHLRQLFNARRGYGSTIRDFGLEVGDAGGDALSAARSVLANMLADVVRFEKRIENPALRTGDRDANLVLHIDLVGTIEGRPQRFKLRYHQAYCSVEVEAAHDG